MKGKGDFIECLYCKGKRTIGEQNTICSKCQGKGLIPVSDNGSSFICD